MRHRSPQHPRALRSAAWRRWALGLRAMAALAALGAGCTSSGDGDDRTCRPGLELACTCPGGGDGTKRCAPDGAGYLPCDCSDSGAAGGAGGAGALGGAGGGGTSGAAGAAAAATGGAGGADAAPSGGAAGAAGASGAGGAAPDGGGVCPPGSVTNVTGGECDLEAQDCDGGLTCSLAAVDGGPWSTACVTLGAGALPRGSSCATHAECAPGLRCTLGKCTRPCCAERQVELCGASGSCELTLQYAQGAAKLLVCTYAPPCTPWAGDCPAGLETDCHLRSGGKIECSAPNYEVDAGSTLGRPCVYLNDCGDSQHCVYPSGFDSGYCRWLCKLSETGAPTSGTVGGPPGGGGCPPGETCRGFSAPAWLGACSP
ncbi:MAG: hypothetical protein IT376_17165 [Polyangiaceae bacterium]|nr:hypothetical protein [Polyangiaceae bacterium]